MFYSKNGVSRFWAGFLLFAGCVATFGCSPSFASPAKSAFMALGDATPAPVPFLDFCARQPGDCRPSRPERSAPAEVRLAAAASLIQTSATSDGSGPGHSPDATLEATPTSASAADGLASDVPDAQPHQDAALLAQLNQFNRKINEAIKPQSDMITNGVADHWDTPLEEGKKVGDCEDYALEKRHALIAAGFPAQALSLAVVRTRWGEMHAILLVDTDRGELVLDNLSPWVTSWRELDYQWIERQAPGQPMNWVSIGGASQASSAG